MQIRREGKSKVVKNCQIYPGPQRVNEQTKTKAPVVPLSDFFNHKTYNYLQLQIFCYKNECDLYQLSFNGPHKQNRNINKIIKPGVT